MPQPSGECADLGLQPVQVRQRAAALTIRGADIRRQRGRDDNPCAVAARAHDQSVVFQPAQRQPRSSPSDTPQLSEVWLRRQRAARWSITGGYCLTDGGGNVQKKRQTRTTVKPLGYPGNAAR